MGQSNSSEIKEEASGVSIAPELEGTAHHGQWTEARTFFPPNCILLLLISTISTVLLFDLFGSDRILIHS